MVPFRYLLRLLHFWFRYPIKRKILAPALLEYYFRYLRQEIFQCRSLYNFKSLYYECLMQFQFLSIGQIKHSSFGFLKPEANASLKARLLTVLGENGIF